MTLFKDEGKPSKKENVNMNKTETKKIHIQLVKPSTTKIVAEPGSGCRPIGS